LPAKRARGALTGHVRGSQRQGRQQRRERHAKGAWPSLAAPVGVLWSSHAGAAAWPTGLPVYDHIVILIVIEENKGYEQIILNKDATFINQLATDGARFTNMFGEERYSQEIICGSSPAPTSASDSRTIFQRRS
jgi:hypothetical protein